MKRTSDFTGIPRIPLCGLLALPLLGCPETSGTLEPEPDPEPLPTVELVTGSILGADHFPAGNTAQGGQGEPVGGIACIDEINLHYHAHVSLFVEGERIAIPIAVGIVDPVVSDGFATSGSCLYWVHTHDATGMIHIETPVAQDFTLGQLFDIWGRPLSETNVAGFGGIVSTFVDGERYEGNPRDIVFTSRKHVSLQVGRPLSPPPMYTFQP
jgi:hypothetical protein